MKTATINSRKVSVRAFPYIPELSEQIVGTLNKGDKITIDDSRLYYDWTDKAFYKCSTPIGDGYVLIDLVDYNRNRAIPRTKIL